MPVLDRPPAPAPSPTPPADPLPAARLGAPIAALLAVASLGGLLWPAVYAAENALVRPQMLAQDAFDLVVALPLLLVAGHHARRGSDAAALAWLGTLAYLVYSFAIYAFSIHHNPLFLVYVALLATSTYALVAGALQVPRDRLAAACDAVPARAIGRFEVAVGVLFALVWLADILAALVAGRPPSVVERYEVPTFAAYVLDLGFALPALVLGGRALAARRPEGYLVGGFMLVMTALMMFQLAVSGAYYGFVAGSMEWGLYALFCSVGAAATAAAIVFARRVAR